MTKEQAVELQDLIVMSIAQKESLAHAQAVYDNASRKLFNFIDSLVEKP